METPGEIRQEPRLYSAGAITLATFFGGPLAAGILMRRNFINCDKPVHGKYALALGIISTIALFAIIFSLSEESLDKIPGAAIPAAYTAIILLLVEIFQGADIRRRKEAGNLYSAWKAFGAGMAGLALIVAVIGTAVLLTGFTEPSFDVALYEAKYGELVRNEEKLDAISGFASPDQSREMAEYIESVSIPALKDNLRLMDEMSAIENCPEPLLEWLGEFRQYTALKIRQCELLYKSITEDSFEHSEEMSRNNLLLNEMARRLSGR